ncbi:SpoIIE family protein phosphatase [Streptomyces canus]|uniref:SpoIIE family protein phosphatase n=1 Tax=Streptomyces canus TaxID=58343 RepID=UPI0036868477
MDFTADSLLSRAAHDLGLGADRLIHDLELRLRCEVPELWDEPDLARIAGENVADHIRAALFGVEQGPSVVRPPVAHVERARQLARRGRPLSAMLRAFRLAQAHVLDSLLGEMLRLTSDAELIGAALRKLIAMTTEYVDRAAELDVLAFHEERDRRVQWRLSVVNEAGLRIGTTLDTARTAQELADLSVEHLADAVTVDLLDSALDGDVPGKDGSVLRRVARQSLRPNGPESKILLQQLHSYPSGSPPARALATGRPVRQQRDAAHPGSGSADATRRTHSTLAVPLRARDVILGVAQFFRHGTSDIYEDEDLLLAQEIGARAAVAIDNARRYTHARTTALTLQRSLLPRTVPEQSAVEVAYRYLPAGAQLGVGGDWYDVIPLSGARVALVVGDVVGHGIQAAATMGRLRTAVRTLADIDLPPDELLTHLDDVVIRLSAEAAAPGGATFTAPDTEAPGDIGATCLYAVYDPVASCCTLARAGHMPPAVVRPDGSVEILDLPAGLPLGLGGLPFETAQVDLPEGSLLVLYTNGLIQACGHDIDAGLTRLRQVLAQPFSSMEATCDAVLEALLPADRPHDDVALLLTRTHALGDRQVASWDVDPDPAAVARARASVAEQLSAWGLEELDFTAGLVVSELVTNAIRYGLPPIRLRLIHDRTLMCEVSDASSTTPHLRRARLFDEGGRGLLLVAQLAEGWGTRHARRGKTVWAACALDGPEPFLGAIEWAADDISGLV